MLGLKKKEVEVLQPIKELPKPKANQVVCDFPLKEYEKVANEVGFLPADLLHKQILQFLRDEKIPVYDYSSVMAYLKRHLELLPPQPRGKDLVVVWVPLRKKDDWGGYVAGFVHNEGSYDKLIPAHVLRDVQKIEVEFKDQVKFFVSDYKVPNPDPFIMVTALQMLDVVFGIWDEPGFGV